MHSSRRALPLVVATVALAASAGRAQHAGGTATVHLGDGSSIPLQDWRLSYDYQSWPKGSTPIAAVSAQRELLTLLAGKRSVELGPGMSVELVRKDGRVRELLVREAGGRVTKLKAEPPRRELLTPDGDGSMIVMAQSVDLVGSTITGTRRSFCLVAFSALVECPSERAQQVVRVELSP